MKRAAALLVTGILVLLVASVDAGAESLPLSRVVVRLHDAFSLPTHGLRIAEQTAEAILATARVQLVWRQCEAASDHADRSRDTCTDRPGLTDIIARIVTAPPAKGRAARPLGYSVIDPATGTGSLATVFADRVRQVAARVGIDGDVLLGRTLAHEIGHLLLGTTHHSTTGLMRAHWPDRMLQRPRQDDWLFTAADAALMNQTVQTRARVLPEQSIAALPRP